MRKLKNVRFHEAIQLGSTRYTYLDGATAQGGSLEGLEMYFDQGLIHLKTKAVREFIQVPLANVPQFQMEMEVSKETARDAVESFELKKIGNKK